MRSGRARIRRDIGGGSCRLQATCSETGRVAVYLACRLSAADLSVPVSASHRDVPAQRRMEAARA